jgi:hypothetical protein
MYRNGNQTKWYPFRQESLIGTECTWKAQLIDKLENVLPPAPEGTVLHKVDFENGDAWKKGDKYPANVLKLWVDIHNGTEGKPIGVHAADHGFICRKPCTWTKKDNAAYPWLCSCGRTWTARQFPDTCPNCNRPIVEAKPEPKLRYVEAGEVNGVKLFKEVEE